MALRIYSLTPIVITIGSTAYPISATSIIASSITIQADYNNVGRISVGGSDLTINNGIQIEKGESAVVEYPTSGNYTDEFDLSLVYITSASAGDTARITYIKRT